MVRPYKRKEGAETKRHRDLIINRRRDKCKCGGKKNIVSKMCINCYRDARTKIKTPDSIRNG